MAFGAVAVPNSPTLPNPPLWFAAVVIAFTAVSVCLSYWPVRNMVSSHQRMNAAFNPYHLMNTYGAFGTVGRTRLEVVVEGTDESDLTEQTVWKEYGFKGKPGDPRRLPRQRNVPPRPRGRWWRICRTSPRKRQGHGPKRSRMKCKPPRLRPARLP